MVAAGNPVGIGEILHRIGHVGIGIEQAAGVAAITHATRSPEPDLHQSIVTLTHDVGAAAAFTLDDTPHKRLWHVVRGGMFGNQCIEI
jgi:hypothetical protein